MLQESEFLPHSLSLFGAVEGPLTGLDLDFLSEASGEQTLSAALMHMIIPHRLRHKTQS